MYDQLGGGFHRYSTDARWLVPHFEKMLYDNALLVVAYAEAHQVTGRADFARVARETLDYVLREMTAPDGGFYSATDADSEAPDGKSEEGQFFVWSEAEIRAAARRRRRRPTGSSRYYGVTPEGNFEGANILAVARPDEASARGAGAAARGAVRGARAPVAAAPRREDPGRLERPGDLGVRGGRARVRRAALRRRGGARGDVRARAHAPGRAAWRAATRTGARRRRLPGGLRLRVRGAASICSRRRSTRAGCATRSRWPTRPSGCSPTRRAAGS